MTIGSLKLQYCVRNLTVDHICEMKNQICRHARKRKVKTERTEGGAKNCLCASQYLFDIICLQCLKIIVQINDCSQGNFLATTRTRLKFLVTSIETVILFHRFKQPK